MTLGGRLREARKQKGYTQKALALKIGAKHNSVSNWENDQNMPVSGTIECLCGVLGVTPNYLLMGSNLAGTISVVPEALSAGEMSLIKKYRLLDARAKGAVDSLLDYYHVQSAPQEEVRRVIEPPAFEVVAGLISTQSVAAGSGTYLDPDSFDSISLVKNDLTRRAAFYVPVAGDSMEPRFHDGDILIVEKAPVAPGEVGIFTLDNHGYVKICGNRELISLNSKYLPIAMNDDVICNGKVIGVLNPDWIVQ